MLDSGVRIAAAFLPVGIPVLVGLVVAVLRRAVLPTVAGPAIAGLVLQLLAILAATFIVAEGSLHLVGLSPQALLTASSILGFGVIILQVLSWTLLLTALFRRLPAPPEDRRPTGRHALLDDRGEQVIAEEGTVLLPVGAAAAGAGAGAGLGAAAAAGVRSDRPAPPPPAPMPPGPPPSVPVPLEPEPEPAATETFAVEPPADHEQDREEPPAVTAESLDEAAQTEDEARPDVADTDPADRDGMPGEQHGAASAAVDGEQEPDAVDVERGVEAPSATAGGPDEIGAGDAAEEPSVEAVVSPADHDPADPDLADPDLADEEPADDDPELADEDLADPKLADPKLADPDPADDLADPDIADTDIADEEPTTDDPDLADPDLADEDDEEDEAAVTDTLPAAGADTTSGPSDTPAPGDADGPEPSGRAATPSGGHPWFDPDGEVTNGASEQAGATRAGSSEGR